MPRQALTAVRLPTVRAAHAVSPSQHVVRYITTVRLAVVLQQARGRHGHRAHGAGRPGAAPRITLLPADGADRLDEHRRADRCRMGRDIGAQRERM
eukprot:2010299-Prymnesium_polylepis.1